MKGSDVLLCFVGMVKRHELVVKPAVEAILEGLHSMGIEDRPKKIMIMSSVGFNDGIDHGYRAWGKCTMCCVGWYNFNF